MKTIVVGLAVTTTGATFYTKDGDTVTRNADDPRLTEFIQKVVTALKTKPEVEVDFQSFEIFGVLEQKSGGLLKFFRVAKTALKSIFGVGDTYGNVNTAGMVSHAPEGDAPQPGTDQVTEEVLGKLAKASEEATKKVTSKADTTVVAVVGGTPIVGAEKLEKQVSHAVKTQNTVGTTKFLERLAGVASKRKHTAQELLHFLEKMDMPFADDGSILAYKSLTSTDEPGIFVDNYSKTLKQGLGTKVQMDVELVDDNRRVLCSNGLHIARMKYLGGYGASQSNVICLVKINPEDVISVPMQEQDKMRVAAYHIVAVLNDTSKAALSSGKSITVENKDVAAMLGRIKAGNHVGVLNITTQHKNRAYDQMVSVNGAVPLAPTVTEAPANPEVVNKPATSVEDQVDTSKTMKEAKVDPKSLNKAIDKAAGVKPPVKPKAPVKARAVKKAAKKATPKSKEVGKAKPIDKPIQKVQKTSQPAKAVSEASPKTQPHEKVSSPVATTAGTVTKGQTAMKLYETWKAAGTANNLKNLLDFKKSAKKGWPVLGFSPEQVKDILDASK